MWHLYIEKLCKELNFTPDRVYELTFTDVCNWLAFFKEKEDYIKKQEDKAKGISRI